jgi:3-oxoacyl-[acyl-carrier-protein] synthase III
MDNVSNKREVYITRLGVCLPNEPLSNDQIEQRLGLFNDKPSRSKAIVLRSNGIKQRYYAIDQTGQSTHTNAQLAKEAILALFDNQVKLTDIEVLSCGTTSPDQILPSHTVMVLGEIKGNAIDIVSPSGSCCTGIHAMNYVYLNLLAGNCNKGVAAGSERMSAWVAAKQYQEEASKLAQLESNPMLAFEKEFLRWMLSDGAGAALLETHPDPSRICFKIEWIEQRGYANELPVCMYAGAVLDEQHQLKGWTELDASTWMEQSVFALKQDTKILADNIVKYGGKFLKDIVTKRKYDISQVNYFLPHLSSEFFGPKIETELREIGIEVPKSKWFYNLPYVGNIGAASPYVMLDELSRSGRLKQGDQILIMVPESARFTYAYVLLTVA